jgi:hypothetical protein
MSEKDIIYGFIGFVLTCGLIAFIGLQAIK